MSSKVRMAHELEKKWRSKDVQLQEKADFSVMLLSERVLTGLSKAGFKTPSPIQLEAIPIGRFGKDLLVQAKSGTGKTLVFTIIALEMLKPRLFRPQVLILAPTREIATQICSVVQSVGSSFRKLTCFSFIGGLPLTDDKEHALTCQIVVGTPGRVRQLIKLGSLPTNSIRLFVFDEADQLLQGTFKMEIDDIFKSLPNDKQVIATSATYPARLRKIIFQFLKDPYIACLNSNELALLGIVHYTQIVSSSLMPLIEYKNKLVGLEQILTKLKFCQCLVFCNMISRVEVLCRDIKQWGFSTAYISSAKEQCDRLKAIDRLKHFKCKVLVSSDVSSRGIDAENVDLVINFDLPVTTETYLHRVGRAGRYGSIGLAVSLITEKQLLYLKKMESEAAFKSYKLPEPLPKDLIRNPCFGQYTIDDDSEMLEGDEAECETVNNYKSGKKVASVISEKETHTDRLISREKASKKKNADVVSSEHQPENGTAEESVEDQSGTDAEDASVKDQHEIVTEEFDPLLETCELNSESQSVQDSVEASAVEYDSDATKSCDSNSIASTKESGSLDFTHGIESDGSVRIIGNDGFICENINEATVVTHNHFDENCLDPILTEGSRSSECSSLSYPCETIIPATMTCNSLNDEGFDCDKNAIGNASLNETIIPATMTYNSVNDEEFGCDKNAIGNASLNENVCLQSVNTKASDFIESTIHCSATKDEGDVKISEFDDNNAVDFQKCFQKINNEEGDNYSKDLDRSKKDECSSDLNKDKKDECSEDLNREKKDDCSEDLNREKKDDCSEASIQLKSAIENYIYKYENASRIKHRNRSRPLETSHGDSVVSDDMLKSLQSKKRNYFHRVFKNFQDEVGKSSALIKDDTDEKQIKVDEKDCNIENDAGKTSSEALCVQPEISNASESINLKQTTKPEAGTTHKTTHSKVLMPCFENLPDFSNLSEFSVLDLSDLSKSRLEDILSGNKPNLHSTPASNTKSIFNVVSSSEESDCDSVPVSRHESCASRHSIVESSSSSCDTAYEEEKKLRRNAKMFAKAKEMLKRRQRNSSPASSGPKYNESDRHSNHLLRSKGAETLCPKLSLSHSSHRMLLGEQRQDPVKACAGHAARCSATNPHRSHFAPDGCNYFVAAEQRYAPRFDCKGCSKNLPQNACARTSHQQQFASCCPEKPKCPNEQRNDHQSCAGSRNQCARNTGICCRCYCQSRTACCHGYRSSAACCSSMTSPHEIFYNQWDFLQRCVNCSF